MALKAAVRKHATQLATILLTPPADTPEEHCPSNEATQRAITDYAVGVVNFMDLMLAFGPSHDTISRLANQYKEFKKHTTNTYLEVIERYPDERNPAHAKSRDECNKLICAIEEFGNQIRLSALSDYLQYVDARLTDRAFLESFLYADCHVELSITQHRTKLLRNVFHPDKFASLQSEDIERAKRIFQIIPEVESTYVAHETSPTAGSDDYLFQKQKSYHNGMAYLADAKIVNASIKIRELPAAECKRYDEILSEPYGDVTLRERYQNKNLAELHEMLVKGASAAVDHLRTALKVVDR